MNRQASSMVPPEPPYSSGMVTPEPAELGHLLVEVLVVVDRVALGQLLALLGGAGLALAEVADRGDEVGLLVGQLEVHGSGGSRSGCLASGAASRRADEA